MPTKASIFSGVIISVIIVIISVLLGYLYFQSTDSSFLPTFSKTTPKDSSNIPSHTQVYDYLFSHIDRDEIKSHLHKLTEEIGWKVSGTQAEYDSAVYIRDYFRQVGLSSVKLVPYQVLLSYPDPVHLNAFQMLDRNDNVVFTANQFEDLTYVNNQSNYDYHLRSIYIAYSPSAKLKAPILYVDYARNEDFEKLKMDVEVICLARYGKISRMIKAENAKSHGCSGLVLYSDHEDYNPKGNQVFYPYSEFLPDTGVQRGTLKNQKLGDYLTPAYPALPEAYRIQPQHSQLPSLPVHLLRQDDVAAIFKLLRCQPRDKCDDSAHGMTASLNISMQQVVKEINNVIGLIPGKEEPDRYVIVGNHYDSWGPGSVDPSIGTSIVMELARVLMALHNHTNWQPRRSILFCEWGSEEYGSLGSREFIEEFSKVFSSRAVAYINTDVAVLGNYSIKFKSQPLLKSLIFNSTRSILEPRHTRDETSSLFETYRRKFPDKSEGGKLPMVGDANTGSDYVHFIGLAAVPSLDVRYTYDESLGLAFYPLYHSGYENFHAFESFIDPAFKYSEVVTKVMADLLLKLSSEPILPYSVDHYVENVHNCIEKVISAMAGTEGLFTEHDKFHFITLSKQLHEKSQKLLSAGDLFKMEVKQMDLQNELTVRSLNDRLMLIQKAFMYEHTLQGRETTRNALHAPSDNGKQVCLAEIHTMMLQFNLPSTNKTSTKQEILKEIARIHFFLDTAISILDPQVLP